MRGCDTLVVDMGVLGLPAIEPDLSRQTVVGTVGERIEALAAGGDRGRAVAAMTRGVERILPELHAQGRFDGVIGIGGSAGTTMATAGMRALPIGVPKLMVSTIAGGDVAPFVGSKDITMVPSIVDISGLNRISRHIFVQAAAAVVAMARAEIPLPTGDDRPLIAASMFGNTTQCVDAARKRLESSGYEVLVFHSTGTGGRTMEDLVAADYFTGVLDVTTTELADELAGGVMSAGPTRLEGAARAGIPSVVVPGCLDMVNFWAPETIPQRYRSRRLYRHNPNVTLMRTTPEENRELGRRLAERVNKSKGPAAVYLPLKGISVISVAEQPF
ncbi:MAG: Tm-1-like ATP-binding domain-containing protein, partial [Bryobacterales bacterium]|nr:Tm-1-like ATP-binding domain-containing protein [Bryobacterales bacterium]